MKFRAYDKGNKTFLDENKLSLMPNGKFIYEGKECGEEIELQTEVYLTNKIELYVGDSVRIKLTNDKEWKEEVKEIIENGCYYPPKDYDELILQFDQVGNSGDIYYWLMFKKDGKYIKNNQTEVPIDNEEDNDKVRAIPMDSKRVIKTIFAFGKVENKSDLTKEDWVDVYA